jgi:hypothetical protein
LRRETLEAFFQASLGLGLAGAVQEFAAMPADHLPGHQAEHLRQAAVGGEGHALAVQDPDPGQAVFGEPQVGLEAGPAPRRRGV